MEEDNTSEVGDIAQIDVIAEEPADVSVCRITFSEKVREFLESFPDAKNLSDKIMAFQEGFSFSENARHSIEELTKTDRIAWRKERCGRITASNFGRILKCKYSCESILLDVMAYQPEISTEAVLWGKTKEKIALQKFIEKISPEHVNLSVRSTGLIIHREEPYLAATPDGIVSCDCHEDHVLEIKCPFSSKDKKISEIECSTSFLDENGILKDTHHYYEQVQGQMAISETFKCYFVTYTEQQVHIQIIEFDECRWENSREILKNFFFSFVLPEIINCDIEKAIEVASNECFCSMKKFSTVLKCRKCEKTFHRQCVKHRRRTPWTCNDCKH